MASTPINVGPSADLVRLFDVTKRFGAASPALDAVSGTIGGDEITGLVGPDGAGKSPLIRILTGLMLPDKGTVEVLGFDVRRDPARIQAAIGYMPQRFGLYEDLTVHENLNLCADLRGLPKADRAGAFDRLLTLTDLTRFTSRLAGKLSGGMKQKLGLACALLKKPRLLLLDKPSVGVDPISRRDLWKMVEDLTNEGVGVVWSTAYLDEAEACDRVFLLNNRKLLFTGAPSQLTSRVSGRVFKLTGMKGRRRPILVKALDQHGGIDGAIQGDAIRLVRAPGVKAETVAAVVTGSEVKVAPTPPRFEDAFIDMLGGGPGG